MLQQQLTVLNWSTTGHSWQLSYLKHISSEGPILKPGLKGYFTPQSKTHTFTFTCSAIYPSEAVLVWVAQFWIYQLQRCWSSLQYNATIWHFVCCAQIAPKKKKLFFILSLRKRMKLYNNDIQYVGTAVKKKVYFFIWYGNVQNCKNSGRKLHLFYPYIINDTLCILNYMDDKSCPYFKERIVSVGFMSAKRVIAIN